MKTILRILKQARGWHHGLSLKIENPAPVALVIDAMDESGPCGLPALSVGQYANGLATPEMCFELSNPLGLGRSLVPFHYRNDYVGVEQFSRTIDGDRYLFLPSLYEQHQKLAVAWDHTLYMQGFLAAFERQRTQR